MMTIFWDSSGEEAKIGVKVKWTLYIDSGRHPTMILGAFTLIFMSPSMI